MSDACGCGPGKPRSEAKNERDPEKLRQITKLRATATDGPCPTSGRAVGTARDGKRGASPRVGNTSTSVSAWARWSRLMLTAVAVAGTVVALLVEPIARRELSGGRTIELGLINFKLTYNRGVAFSIGDGLPTWTITAATAAIAVGVCIYAWRAAPSSSRTAVVGLAAIAAGAATNVLDRAADGKVTDYFHTGWWPTFNLADTYLTFGFVLLAAAMLCDIFRPRQESTGRMTCK